MEQGAYGAVRRLVALGADDPGDLRRLGEQQRAAWLKTSLVKIGARREKRRGKHRYLLCVGGRAARRATARGIALPRMPYPKHDLFTAD
ncbi:hypothetical protein [Actinoplanes aureus]|uniref:Uncharacterized protein n=1 Tax=Actinoplanes aureus TaxID=2792083 RepID=A0A931CHP5_9ACTN|nr:hypothetical protein [Actinoplanes aureus]MBG0568804.1 hypothetical protein [Actinoplanes aureus]